MTNCAALAADADHVSARQREPIDGGGSSAAPARSLTANTQSATRPTPETLAVDGCVDQNDARPVGRFGAGKPNLTLRSITINPAPRTSVKPRT